MQLRMNLKLGVLIVLNCFVAMLKCSSTFEDHTIYMKFPTSTATTSAATLNPMIRHGRSRQIFNKLRIRGGQRSRPKHLGILDNLIYLETNRTSGSISTTTPLLIELETTTTTITSTSTIATTTSATFGTTSTSTIRATLSTTSISLTSLMSIELNKKNCCVIVNTTTANLYNMLRRHDFKILNDTNSEPILLRLG